MLFFVYVVLSQCSLSSQLLSLGTPREGNNNSPAARALLIGRKTSLRRTWCAKCRAALAAPPALAQMDINGTKCNAV